ncbi:hypothetical protein MMC13_004351 [Lambiella insularis]|nr:hypothetical protein [Lambiella insularis]
MSSTGHVEEPKNFAPKTPVKLDPPKSDPITVEELAKCNVALYIDCELTGHMREGKDSSKPTLVAIKGTVFDVTGNASYDPEKGPYRVFAGKDASRALAMSSVKPEDCVAQWEDLPDKEKKVLDEWMTFFSKRYNIVGKVVS